jgi:purine-nucleoside phosphorylase
MSHAHAVAKQIQAAAGTEPIEFAMILGSGLSQLIDKVEGTAIPYSELDGFPQPSVSGHDPKLVIGSLFGRCVGILGAREHYYEHGNPAAMRLPLEVMCELGATRFIATNAAGSMRSDIPPGELMLIADHINFSGLNPLIGEPTERRFVPMSGAYDQEMREELKAAAHDEGIILKPGVYAWYSGPSFETPAEIRAILRLGADAVGMSTVPEVILARFLGLRVAAISVITNMAAGLSDEAISHEHTKEMAPLGAEKLERLLSRMLTKA